MKEQIIHSLRVATKVIVGKIKVEKKGIGHELRDTAPWPPTHCRLQSGCSCPIYATLKASGEHDFVGHISKTAYFQCLISEKLVL